MVTAFALEYRVFESEADGGFIAYKIGAGNISAFGKTEAEAIEELKNAHDFFMESEKDIKNDNP